MVDAEMINRIEALQTAYIAALDSKDMAAWLRTFIDDERASYTCISAENVAAGLPVALMLDDNRARLQDRVTFVDKVWAGTFQPYSTRHFVQPLAYRPMPCGLYHVRSNFCVTFAAEDSGQLGVLATGIYEDEILVQCEIAAFVSKRAVMDANVLPRYVVYPL